MTLMELRVHSFQAPTLKTAGHWDRDFKNYVSILESGLYLALAYTNTRCLRYNPQVSHTHHTASGRSTKAQALKAQICKCQWQLSILERVLGTSRQCLTTSAHMLTPPIVDPPSMETCIREAKLHEWMINLTPKGPSRHCLWRTFILRHILYTTTYGVDVSIENLVTSCKAYW